ncbi:MAG: VanW family protein, partial [Patescibacteria group bacterium]
MIANYTSKYAYIITTLGILFILSILVFFTYIFNKDKEYSNAIYPNVIIDNIELGGATKNDAKLIFEKKYQYIQNTQIRVQFEKENIATVSGQQLNIRTDAENLIENAYLIGRSKNIVGRLYEQASTLFGLREFTYTTTVVYETSALDKIVRSIEKKYNKPAKNALFSFENNRVVSFRQEEKGRRIKSEVLTSSIQKNITEAKNSKNPSFTVILEKEVINPEITLAKVNQFGIEELIGVGKSDYSHSIPERVHNVLHAASKFNGVLIPPGATFSFNDTIGDITQATGYKQAYIIKSGKTVLGDGGGVCQVSTTLFRAALNTGLPIVDRTA